MFVFVVRFLPPNISNSYFHHNHSQLQILTIFPPNFLQFKNTTFYEKFVLFFISFYNVICC